MCVEACGAPPRTAALVMCHFPAFDAMNWDTQVLLVGALESCPVEHFLADFV